jgi:hypothetical protein
MDVIRPGQGKPPQPGAEAYTPRHLELLRLAGYLIQSGDTRLLDALEVLLEALLSSHRSPSERLPSTFPPPVREPPQRPE